MLTGSMAMAIYAVLRMPRDVDLVIIECHLEDSAKIARLFEADCYVNEDSIRKAVIKRSMFNIIHNEWMIKADFIVRGDEEYTKLEFERRKRFEVDDTPIWVVAPEDLILPSLSGLRTQIRRSSRGMSKCL